MIIFSEVSSVDIIVGLVFLILLFYWYLTRNNDYWKKKSVPFVKPVLFFGNYLNVFLRKEAFNEITLNLYNQFEGERYGGYFFFHEPILLIRDVNLIKRVLTSDFSSFHDRCTPSNLSNKLSNSLSTAKGERWRIMRYRLNMAFTASKLKGMFEQILHSGDNIVQQIEENLYTGKELDVFPLILTFANEVVGSCVFGINISADLPQRLEFFEMIDKVFRTTPIKFLKFALSLVFPRFVSVLRFQLIPKSVEDYFINITKAAVEYRKNNNIKRNDFLHLFLTLKEQEEKGKFMGFSENVSKEEMLNDPLNYASENLGPTEKVFTDDSIAASLFGFLSVGSVYTASTIGFALLELAKEPDIQRSLQEEVDTIVDKHGTLTYQAAKEMIYLDQVIQETMRIHTVGSPIGRVVTKKYPVPGSDLVLDPGMHAFISVAGIHRDPQYYPSPLQFNPDRFQNNNYKHSPTFFPFGQGPRMCVVMQFAILELKVCLARIVSRFSFTLSNKTQLPLRIDPRARFPKPLGGVWLNLKHRQMK